ncbi:IS66 family insertion sequence element accessory protein TnpA [Inconstantimicrobium porci]|uniref:IS66 family insertion sequence element accessory protein TnpA n=1 Tax=Inconstantimicrobium porci TaxID=2652291 RepID=UPI0038B28291
MRYKFGIIKACKSSGLSNKAWCEQNNINLKRYYYWQSKFKKSICKHQEMQRNLCEESHEIVPLSSFND